MWCVVGSVVGQRGLKSAIIARPDVVRGRECCGPGDLFKRIVCIVQFKHVQQGFRQSGKTTCRGHEL